MVYTEAKKAMQQVMLEEAFNIERQIQRIAMRESAQFVIDNIELDKICRGGKLELLDRCLALVLPDGLILEFGVFSGNTIRYIAERVRGRHVYGFDSFEGLREAWFHHKAGLFNLDGKLPSVPENVILIKGMFQDTGAAFLANHPGHIAFLHIDADLYSSCEYVLTTYGHRIVPGTIIVFDEFYNYHAWKGGEYKAFQEWCHASATHFEYLGFTSERGPVGLEGPASGQQVAVKIISRAATSEPSSASVKSRSN
jgi:hypothetical protein